MTKLSRNQFIQRYDGKSFELNRLRGTESEQTLQRLGMGEGQLRAADLNNDGRIHGTREVNALFRQVDTFDRVGTPDSVKISRFPGRVTAAGRVVRVMDLMFERHTEPDRLTLQGPVGAGQTNRPEDVRAVQQRLREVGFEDMDVDGAFGNQTRSALQVYEGMITGADHSEDMSGSITPGSRLHRTLGSEDAPRWTTIPSSGVGFVNQDTDGFSHGSERMVNVIRDAGQRYNDEYLSANPNAGLISLNDASLRSGGPNGDHHTHENGLDMDIRLPTTSGGAGTTVHNSNYDRDAAYAMVEAFATDERVQRVIISDDVLRERAAENEADWVAKVFDGGRVHENHIHVDVSPPEIIG